MRHPVKDLQTINELFTWRVPNFISKVTWPISLILLPLADESYMPVHGCNMLVLCNFLNKICL